MTDANVFVDTNVLLRSMMPGLPLHEAAKSLITRQVDNGKTLWISRQIIRELLAQMTRTGYLDPPLTIEDAVVHIETLENGFEIADETAQVTHQLLQLARTFPTGGKQIHDANIVATMLVYGIDTLLMTNVDDMRRFASLIRIISPEPPAIGST